MPQVEVVNGEIVLKGESMSGTSTKKRKTNSRTEMEYQQQLTAVDFYKERYEEAKNELKDCKKQLKQLRKKRGDIDDNYPLSSLTKDNIERVWNKTQDALNTVGAEMGMTFKFGKIKYTAPEFKVTTFTGTVNGFDKTAAAATAGALKEAEFNLHCRSFGLQPSDRGRPIRSTNGKIFILDSIMPQNTKYPIIGTGKEDNKSYKLTESQLQNFSGQYNFSDGAEGSAIPSIDMMDMMPTRETFLKALTELSSKAMFEEAWGK